MLKSPVRSYYLLPWLFLILLLCRSSGSEVLHRHGCMTAAVIYTRLHLICPVGKRIEILSARFAVSAYGLCIPTMKDCFQDAPLPFHCCHRQRCLVDVENITVKPCGGWANYYQVKYICRPGPDVNCSNPLETGHYESRIAYYSKESLSPISSADISNDISNPSIVATQKAKPTHFVTNFTVTSNVANAILDDSKTHKNPVHTNSSDLPKNETVHGLFDRLTQFNMINSNLSEDELSETVQADAPTDELSDYENYNYDEIDRMETIKYEESTENPVKSSLKVESTTPANIASLLAMKSKGSSTPNAPVHLQTFIETSVISHGKSNHSSSQHSIASNMNEHNLTYNFHTTPSTSRPNRRETRSERAVGEGTYERKHRDHPHRNTEAAMWHLFYTEAPPSPRKRPRGRTYPVRPPHGRFRNHYAAPTPFPRRTISTDIDTDEPPYYNDGLLWQVLAKISNKEDSDGTSGDRTESSDTTVTMRPTQTPRNDPTISSTRKHQKTHQSAISSELEKATPTIKPRPINPSLSGKPLEPGRSGGDSEDRFRIMSPNSPATKTSFLPQNTPRPPKVSRLQHSSVQKEPEHFGQRSRWDRYEEEVIFQKAAKDASEQWQTRQDGPVEVLKNQNFPDTDFVGHQRSNGQRNDQTDWAPFRPYKEENVEGKVSDENLDVTMRPSQVINTVPTKLIRVLPTAPYRSIFRYTQLPPQVPPQNARPREQILPESYSRKTTENRENFRHAHIPPRSSYTTEDRAMPKVKLSQEPKLDEMPRNVLPSDSRMALWVTEPQTINPARPPVYVHRTDPPTSGWSVNELAPVEHYDQGTEKITTERINSVIDGNVNNVANGKEEDIWSTNVAATRMSFGTLLTIACGEAATFVLLLIALAVCLRRSRRAYLRSREKVYLRYDYDDCCSNVTNATTLTSTPRSQYAKRQTQSTSTRGQYNPGQNQVCQSKGSHGITSKSPDNHPHKKPSPKPLPETSIPKEHKSPVRPPKQPPPPPPRLDKLNDPSPLSTRCLSVAAGSPSGPKRKYFYEEACTAFNVPLPIPALHSNVTSTPVTSSNHKNNKIRTISGSVSNQSNSTAAFDCSIQDDCASEGTPSHFSVDSFETVSYSNESEAPVLVDSRLKEFAESELQLIDEQIAVLFQGSDVGFGGGAGRVSCSSYQC